MSLLQGLRNAFQALDCQVLGATAYVQGSLSRFLGLEPGLATNAINGYRRLRGCGEGGDVPVPEGEFPGGQCPVQYSAGSSGTATCPGSPDDFAGGIASGLGPISGVTRVVTERPNFPANRLTTWTLSFADGDRQASIAHNDSVTPCLRVFPTSGEPDICGDLPGEFPPPTDLTINVDVDFIDEGDNNVSVTIPVTFKPFTVNFNNDVRFPFTFSLGGIDFNGEVQFAPEFNLTVSGPQLPPGPINLPEPSGEPVPSVPLAPRGNKVQGVIVTATLDPNVEVSSYEGGPVPDIFVPRLGSVKFAYSFGASTVWSNDIDVKGTRVFIPCPFSQGADAVFAQPQPGVSFAIAQLTGPPLATVADLVG